MTEYDYIFLISKIERIYKKLLNYNKKMNFFAKNNLIHKIQKLDPKYIDTIIDFTQTIYMLKEKLKLYFPNFKKDIEELYNDNPKKGLVNAVGLVKSLANGWKHKNRKIELYNCTNILMSDEGIINVGVFHSYTKKIKNQKDSDPKEDLCVIKLVKDCRKELFYFLKNKLNYKEE